MCTLCERSARAVEVILFQSLSVEVYRTRAGIPPGCMPAVVEVLDVFS